MKYLPALICCFFAISLFGVPSLLNATGAREIVAPVPDFEGVSESNRFAYSDRPLRAVFEGFADILYGI